ncbi:hypothetical protein ACNHKD_08085 [Methylocystis sp. JAN1]|uniref:hypothetical protein n=1 Tax=Methylocystis sp. JAN1 TaxID=3397211 RepID=UPI003FA2BB46
MSLFSALAPPNGAVIPNRIAKAAMEEKMAAGWRCGQRRPDGRRDRTIGGNHS